MQTKAGDMFEISVNILFIEADPRYARTIADQLARTGDAPVNLDVSGRLSTGLELLAKGDFDVVLLDLSLPDSQGLTTLVTTRDRDPDMPIIVLTDLESQTMATAAIGAGAQDYLIKKNIDGSLLIRSIHYAIERKRVDESLRASREHFRSMMEDNADAIVVVDGEGVTRYINPAAEAMFDRSSEELVGQFFGFPVVAGKTTEVDIIGSQNRPGVAEMRVAEIEWEGEPAHIATLRDVTKHRLAETALATVNAQLTEKNEMLAELSGTAQQFMDNVSLQFSTPLTAIVDYTSALLHGQGGPISDRQGQYLALIGKAAGELSHMVDDLLDCSRLRTDALRVNRGRCSIAEIVTAARSTLAGKAEDKRITLSEDLPDELPEVFGDEDKVRRVLINLADNAITFSPEGAEVRLWAAKDERGRVRIGVTGQGLGVSQEELGVICAHFSRTGQVTKEGSGFGLGLYVANELAGLNLGRIQVESHAEDFTTFSFALPRYDWPDIVETYFAQLADRETPVPVSVLELTVDQAGPVLPDVRSFLAATCWPMDIVLGSDEGDSLVVLGPSDNPDAWIARLQSVWLDRQKDESTPPLNFPKVSVAGTWPCPAEADRAQVAATRLLARGLVKGR